MNNSNFSKPIYLDYAATTPVDARVVQEMIKYMSFENNFGNSASNHFYGFAAEKAILSARKNIAELINATPQEIIFTSGATEANNLAIRGVAEFYEGRHFVTLKTEHKSVLETYQVLEQNGFEVTYLDVEKNGQVNLDNLKSALRDDTVMVSIMHVNNELGIIQDLKKISELVHSKKILLHVDAAQSAGKIPIDVEEFQIDLLSLSAHKIYGPKGIGALYVRQKPRVRIIPQITGGGQERNLRSGTLATHQIVGMGTAFALAKELLESESQRLTCLREKLFLKLSSLEGIALNNDLKNCAPHILNISFEGVNGEALLARLNLAISSGSACNTHHIEPSYVLGALGVSQELAQSTLRLSIGRYTTEQDIEDAAQMIIEQVNYLREISPYWRTEDKIYPNLIAFHSENPTSLTRCSFYINVEQDRILAVQYRVYGCHVTIACAVWVAQFLENKNFTEVKKLQVEDIITELKISPEKNYCAQMVFNLVKEMVKAKK